jgi:hypothetical protein
VTTFIEDVYVDDTTFDAEGEAENALGAAIARALDLAVLFGEDAPRGSRSAASSRRRSAAITPSRRSTARSGSSRRAASRLAAS